MAEPPKNQLDVTINACINILVWWIREYAWFHNFITLPNKYSSKAKQTEMSGIAPYAEEINFRALGKVEVQILIQCENNNLYTLFEILNKSTCIFS